MPIPQTAEFTAVLETLRVVERPGEPQAFNVPLTTRGARTADGQQLPAQPLSLTADDGGLTLASFIGKIRQELARNNHPDSASIAGCILALVTLLPRGLRLARLNEILEST